ncbi:MAG: T9SS type A sorting domain-containing protein [Melioribacteraceae bacterium]|nr:T9SS type A sorting domain-containing protein [Melioribacteraceae bacterium]
MKKKILCLILLTSLSLYSQQFPLVYEVENTCLDCPTPYLPTINELLIISSLPDPFMWSDGRGRIKYFSDWKYRRAEIAAEIQHYEIGEKPPRPADIKASYSNGLLTVIVTVNGNSLTLTSQINLPNGTGPFPAVIGINSPTGSMPQSIFTSRNIALITYNINQVTTYGNHKNTDPYYKLYPHLNVDNTGQYSAWAWGVSRIIDGLELVKNILPIDTKRLAVTGCSYAGKLALFAGAFDERIALTIAQESGGGGYTTWRFSEEINKSSSVETLGKTDYNWFRNSMNQFSNSVSKIPMDHHELMALVAPRALFVTGNPDYTWLADESGHVGSNAAKEVWKALGVSDRFGFSIIGGHSHCSVPASQIPEIELFIEKFLLGNNNVNTNVATTPFKTNLSNWITWTTPILQNGNSYFGKTIQVYPENAQKGIEKNVTLKWKKIKDAEKYIIQLSSDPAFIENVKKDSTSSDTSKTIINLEEGKLYYWRVQVKSSQGYGPWSDVWKFTTYIPLPDAPQLISAAPYQGRKGWITFKWKKVKNADEYDLQISYSPSFFTVIQSASTKDTTTTLFGLDEGQTYYWRVQAKNISGAGPWSNYSSVLVNIEEENIPYKFCLYQNYPNPFNPLTTIEFEIPQEENVKLILYNSLGNEEAIILNEIKKPGKYSIGYSLDSYSSGVYFYKLQTKNFSDIKKMILVK